MLLTQDEDNLMRVRFVFIRYLSSLRCPIELIPDIPKSNVLLIISVRYSQPI